MINHYLKKCELLEQALEAFQKTTGIMAVAKNDPSSSKIIFANQDIKCHFAVEVKLTFNKYIIAFEAGTKPATNNALEPKILVTRFVTPQMAEQLKALNMHFLDTAGNAYLNQPQMFVYIKGCKLQQPLSQKRVKRTFRAAGLQVIFALLCHPGFENRPFRKIAQVANVALGSVDAVIQDLRQMDYLIDMGGRKRQLVQKQKLLERWVMAYPEQLRPKLLLGKYQATDENWWQQTDLNPFDAYWGGEVAAAKLTQYLKPLITTVYMKPPLGQFILEHRLRKHSRGNVEMLEKFWQFECLPQNRIVPPLLVYADLIATGNARNIETARIIYEKEIIRLIQSD
jgi:hypothetical protein